jgi:hypothetical protein
MWGNQIPTAHGVAQLANAFVLEWNWAIDQMLRHWERPPVGREWLLTPLLFFKSLLLLLLRWSHFSSKELWSGSIHLIRDLTFVFTVGSIGYFSLHSLGSMGVEIFIWVLVAF